MEETPVRVPSIDRLRYRCGGGDEDLIADA
jgi:hypothetical protein